MNLLTNGGFKAFFGDENNKNEVMEVINSLLPEHYKVIDIEYMPTEHQGQVVDLNKTMHYDYMCRDKSGAIFIVEMQQYKEKHWFKRCVSYACRSYDRQNHKGEKYDVPPVFLIGLMGGVTLSTKSLNYGKTDLFLNILFEKRRLSRCWLTQYLLSLQSLQNSRRSQKSA